METTQLEQFRAFLVQRGKSKRAIECDLFCLKKFARSYPLTLSGLSSFVLDNRGKYRHSYINKHIFAIRVYATCMGLEDGLKNFKPLKDQPFSKATLSLAEITAFLSLKPEGNEDRRLHRFWVLFFKTVASTGMRTGEVANLKIDDVDFGREVFVLQETKTGKPRNVPIPRSLIPELQQRITEVSKHVFENPRSGGLPTDSEWHYQFHKRINKLGIKRKNLTPYSLRHSFITRLLEEDINIFKVQKIVGHSNIATTAGYTHLTTKDIIKTIAKDPMELQNMSPQDAFEAIRGSLKNTLLSIPFTDDLRHELIEDDKSISIRVWKP